MKSLSHVQLLATPWTAAHQAPPPMGFSGQEYWSGISKRCLIPPQTRRSPCLHYMAPLHPRPLSRASGPLPLRCPPPGTPPSARPPKSRGSSHGSAPGSSPPVPTLPGCPPHLPDQSSRRLTSLSHSEPLKPCPAHQWLNSLAGIHRPGTGHPQWASTHTPAKARAHTPPGLSTPSCLPCLPFSLRTLPAPPITQMLPTTGPVPSPSEPTLRGVLLLDRHCVPIPLHHNYLRLHGTVFHTR